MNDNESIYQNLSRRIAENEFPVGTMLPGLRVLAEQYKQTTISVRHALDILKMEGVVYSHHGKGNFVQKKPAIMKKAMLISLLEGDLYSDILSEFSKIFSSLPEHQLILEESPFQKSFGSKESGMEDFHKLELKLDAVINNGGLDAVFFNSLDSRLAGLLSNVADKTKVYCFFNPKLLPEIKCSAVTSDYFHGGSTGVRHLHDAGCRKLLVITHRTDIYSPNHPINSFIDGCIKTAEALGDSLIVMKHQVEHPDYVGRFLGIMTENPDIDGVYACADYRLSPIYPALNRLGRRIGEDIAVLGYCNTPLTMAFNPELSSVDLKPRKIVSEVCDMYLHGNRNEIVRRTVLPEIVARASSKLNRNSKNRNKRRM